jgi:hypothetical protein
MFKLKKWALVFSTVLLAYSIGGFSIFASVMTMVELANIVTHMPMEKSVQVACLSFSGLSLLWLMKLGIEFSEYLYKLGMNKAKQLKEGN